MTRRFTKWDRASPEQRFAAKYIKRPGGCWEWRAAQNGYGYGVWLDPSFSTRSAHRVSWILYRGPIPDGMQVLHRCDNRACVNPDHLFLGTQRDNMHDMWAKGRQKTNKLPTAAIQSIKLSSEPVERLAELYGVSISAIYRVRRGETWRSV